MGLPAMLVTVALCTWNRDKLLDKTLAGMNELRIPDGVTWEILVVNNNCTDDTDAVIERLARPFRFGGCLSRSRGIAIRGTSQWTTHVAILSSGPTMMFASIPFGSTPTSKQQPAGRKPPTSAASSRPGTRRPLCAG